MMLYTIIETDGGLTVAELEPGASPEEAATRENGTVVDPGPYRTYDDAYDAILALQREEEEEPDDLL
jgi:hypothetical protein